MQAIGLIVGPLVALLLLSSGMPSSLTWRVPARRRCAPAAAVIYLRSKMPESPRFEARVKGDSAKAAHDLNSSPWSCRRLKHDRARRLASWACEPSSAIPECSCSSSAPRFVVPLRLCLLRQHPLAAEHPEGRLSHSEPRDKLLLTLALFVIFAVPGYFMAVLKMDRIGHRRLQFVGFAVMALCFLVLAAVPVLTTAVGPFIPSSD